MEKYHTTTDPKKLLEKLITLRKEIKDDGDEIYNYWENKIERDLFKKSAKNLSYYLALRNRDITELQRNLIPWGLSSLGRLESKTLATLDTVIKSLADIANIEKEYERPAPSEFDRGRLQLQKNSELIFGQKPEKREIRIMVTMPDEAASDKKLVSKLIQEGMNVARINLAHNEAKDWKKMITTIRKASDKADRDIKILMDIAGPKTRTEWVHSSKSKPKVKKGDKVRITRDFQNLPKNDVNFTAGCDLDLIYEQIEIGQSVLYDDGLMESKVIEITDDSFVLEVTKTKESSVRVKAKKGLNFPNNKFTFDSLSEKDKRDIAFACKHADIIGCSYVNNGHDIELVQDEIEKTLAGDAGEMALMAKIETVDGVRNLPQIIFRAASKNPFSIMMARGDLAAESSYIDLASFQQEILWISEAADVPVIWATEVLESLVNDGIPTRSEVTDAAEGTGEDCIMLNKGDYLVEAVAMLNNIIERMEPVQYKKPPLLGRINYTNITSDKNQ